MTSITDEDMHRMMARTGEYSVVILRAGPNRHAAGAETIIWEHGRRNFTLRGEGILSIVCPVMDGSEVGGIGIFSAGTGRAREIMDHDPAVKAGIFTYEIRPCRSFPGDCLPG